MSPKMLYTGIAIVLAVVVVTLFFFYPRYLGGVGSQMQNSAQNPGSGLPSVTSQTQSTQGASSLQAQDVTVGTGATATAGSQVEVSYVGKLADGTIFDQSSAHGGTFSFILGAGQVIPGWDQGVAGMKVGGERVLVIPPTLAYGASGMGPIPPNATLTFDVKLVSVKAVSGNTPYIPQGSQTQ